jgi:hypothetical protein
MSVVVSFVWPSAKPRGAASPLRGSGCPPRASDHENSDRRQMTGPQVVCTLTRGRGRTGVSRREACGPDSAAVRPSSPLRSKHGVPRAVGARQCADCWRPLRGDRARVPLTTLRAAANERYCDLLFSIPFVSKNSFEGIRSETAPPQGLHDQEACSGPPVRRERG